METLQLLKKSKLLILSIMLLQSCVSTKFECTDKKACALYEQKLEVLSDFLFFGKELSDSNEEPYALFFENLTGHKSEADIQYSGQQPPTINDYEIWSAWYTLNHNQLRYDTKKKKVYVVQE